MIFCFDLDNMICKTKKKKYNQAKPATQTIKLINEVYKQGHKVVIFTGRFYEMCGGNLKKIAKRRDIGRISKLCMT